MHDVMFLHRSSFAQRANKLGHCTLTKVDDVFLIFAYLSNNSPHWLRGSKLRLPKTKRRRLPQSSLSRYGMFSFLSHREELVNRTTPLHSPLYLRAGRICAGVNLRYRSFLPQHRRDLSRPSNYNKKVTIACVIIQQIFSERKL